jgi:phosphoenolpyruvate carboxylase
MHQIPVVMATQHPDNSRDVYFKDTPFMDTSSEVEECFRMFSDLDCDEYMWDWEGKFVDEAVVDKLFRTYYDYFQKNKLGKDKFLTFRVPNIWQESGHRLIKAFMNIITASEFAKSHDFYEKPIFEIILPMTESSEQLHYLFDKYKKVFEFYAKEFEGESSVDHLEIIPLVEETSQLIDVKTLLTKYTKLLKENHNHTPEYLRLFIARSDPAMNAGIIPAVLAAKAAISECFHFEEETGIPVYSWLGGGGLPFRGGVNPENVDRVIDEYAGLQSITVQSAFRYDYPLEDVKSSIQTLKKRLPIERKNYQKMDEDTLKQVQLIDTMCGEEFRLTVEGIADTINQVAANVPSRRERIIHVGLFGYSRGVGSVKLPRAIKFTASLYSLGVPPELIGTGRGIKRMREAGNLHVFEKYYKQFQDDLIHAGHYLNKENLGFLIKENPAWEAIAEDIRLIEEYLGESLGPCSKHHFIHRNITSNIYFERQVGDDYTEDIIKAAKIRKSLG